MTTVLHGLVVWMPVWMPVWMTVWMTVWIPVWIPLAAVVEVDAIFSNGQPRVAMSELMGMAKARMDMRCVNLTSWEEDAVEGQS